MAYCIHCGAPIDDSARFCQECGGKQPIESAPQESTPVSAAPEEPAAQAPKAKSTPRKRKPTPAQHMEAGQVVGGSGSIRLCADGKYRWVYEFSMLKNPTLLFTIWKVLALSAMAPALVSSLASIGDGIIEMCSVFFSVYPVVLAIMLVLGLLGYIIVAFMYGLKYIVLFEMDEDGVVHIQQDKQFKKAEGIAWLNMLAGAATNNLGMTGRGLLIATKNSSSSDFAHVKKLTALRRRNTIKLDSLFSHNQVYVEKADWEFVWDYISTRCTKAKIK